MQALEQLQPDIILIEGPPEGEALLRWAHDPEMAPPVALLAYMPDSPQQAAFYPFATYSPEWQAIQYTLAKGLQVRFIDMPLTHKLALQQTETEEAPQKQDPDLQAILRPPLRFLAEAAGYTDAELWWEQQFELRHYQPEYNTIIPETRIGYGRRQKAIKDIVLCIDQSGSMGTSMVYSGIFGA